MKISDNYLTKGWNNLLTVIFALPVAIYTALILSGSEEPNLTDVAILTLPLGALYWGIAEQHANARFARLLENKAISPGCAVYPVYVVYNLAYWMPLVLALTNTIDDRTAFIACAVIIGARTVFHVYRNNFLTPEQAFRTPFRAP